jgi:hypothetical protein
MPKARCKASSSTKTPPTPSAHHRGLQRHHGRARAPAAPWLARLTNHNAQGEYYLTDMVAMAVADGVPVVAHRITDALQVAGVNSPLQLAELERAHQLRHRAGLDGARRAPGRPGAL